MYLSRLCRADRLTLSKTCSTPPAEYYKSKLQALRLPNHRPNMGCGFGQSRTQYEVGPSTELVRPRAPQRFRQKARRVSDISGRQRFAQQNRESHSLWFFAPRSHLLRERLRWSGLVTRRAMRTPRRSAVDQAPSRRRGRPFQPQDPQAYNRQARRGTPPRLDR